MVQESAGSPTNASAKEKKMLQIRGDLQGLLYKEDWSAIEFMIRGVFYADKELAVSMIMWKNKWQQEEQTLLHDILSMPDSDPPMTLLQMVIDMAPNVLFMEDESGNLPLHTAIYSKAQKEGKTRSLEIIRFLVQCDPERKTLSPITFWQSIRRGADEDVTRYLLTYSECAQALVMKVNGRVPLYYSSKNAVNDDKISPLLKIMIEATSDELNRRSCCFYQSIENCTEFMYDPEAILELAQKEKLYCTNHLIDVARRRDTLAAKREKDAATTTEQNGENASENDAVESDSKREKDAATTTEQNGENASENDAVESDSKREKDAATTTTTEQNGENASENGAVASDSST